MLHRRTVLAVLAAATTTSAFAQSRAGKADGTATTSGPEARHIEQTMTVGSLSLALSRIAEQKVRFQKLKEFSQLEVAEQQTVADVLKSLQKPGLASGTVKPATEAEVEEGIDQSGRQALQQLRAAQPGPAFDTEYLDAEVEGHNKLLRIQEEYLRAGRSLDSLNVAKLVRGMVKEHLQLLSDIRAEMGANTTGAAPARP